MFGVSRRPCVEVVNDFNKRVPGLIAEGGLSYLA